VDVTDATFEREVLASELPVVVDFWAPWCRPCRAVERVLTELAAAEAGRFRLARLNVDENVGVPSRYGVLSLPTVILFTGGEPRETLAGPHSRGRYERALAPYLA
jgi:thioredoxin 1